MAKEKSINPAQAARKAEKARAVKKSKAQLLTQRIEKLARRNPDRLQRQIDDLKSLEQAEGLKPRDRQQLTQLEKDIAAIRKAREALGDKAPKFGGAEREHRSGNERRDKDQKGNSRIGGVLGKRRRDDRGGQQSDAESSSETDEDARNIPMPKDTPPPLPRRDNRRQPRPNNPNETPLGELRMPHALPPKPVAQTVYEAAPMVRDLRKEATSRFVPTAVQSKLKLVKGQTPGRLIEPEELERLEKEGYKDAEKMVRAAVQETEQSAVAGQVKGVEVDLDAEEERFEEELKKAEMEEIELANVNAEKAAEAAVQEAEFNMMAAEANGQITDLKSQGDRAEMELRKVEMEEIDDEDL
ncbi:hypothetical protein AOQ84DRAFT_173045 [Glonium stellatum]|uniref:Wbp11/ELF5/Saf1 N-terminal domain-containing protein n=1 Tax=Glonium stellatum TaxID=574774 RepID=A0A8E2JWL1_9PEZI|nr:hypothetical protein AOQ84DRAFT_173045 [Glonium stellatum]